ncbi:hypothetical protein LENED_009295 [Lentinula edodes]|uniref:Uncharacterized protein n=1 Tax=Lentinula edodes TaxID=5353 RepID=A0A1Q3EJL7_LENED|nr:hypothetical protein LENED_009295 [Lentinula edodes]
MQAAPETQIEIIVRNSEEISIVREYNAFQNIYSHKPRDYVPVKADPAGAGPAPGPLLPEKSNKAREVDVEVVLLAKEKCVVLFLVPKADTLGRRNPFHIPKKAGKGKLSDSHIGAKPVDSLKIALDLIQSYFPVSSSVTIYNGSVSSTRETVSMEENIEKADVESAAPATNATLEEHFNAMLQGVTGKAANGYLDHL